MERISWDQYFMTQSHLLSLRSTCTRLAVGATIVRDKRIIAGGYNGSITGGVHCIDDGCYVIDNHCVRTIHAEMNALLQCAKFGAKTDGAEIYVTHFPCLQCCKAIIQSGITAVYYAQDYKNHPYAVELFQQANVKVKHVPLEYDITTLEQQQRIIQVKELFASLEKDDLTMDELQQVFAKAKDML
ncbi:ComE operon protein 2 [Bacillus sp. DX1.1]|uniref:ComE operon protein 2 n=1 Tax=unclassified Bacillus (in: firmicutes) TaxID=185979 RepID=UPI0025702AE0|nr:MULTISPECIES: ComE operon protein 2 [unclassified Bacillus (in: firmicutes)]MDM5156524.1 ComE operon protein 2 [Bacillus sp. DX1.1]WJE80789.1 ComE operon protein 2 [Bacillus sp. DX3.1]